MRTSTGILLLLLIVLFAIFGWKVLGILALLVLLVPLFVAVGTIGALWWFRRRVRKATERFAQAVREAVQREARTPPAGGQRDGTGAIDVEGHVKDPTGSHR